jgi:hypothetical protein
VTVGFVPKTIALDRIVALCDRLGSSTAAPIVVRWAGAETGDIYYQTLFLRAVATSTLSAMNDAFQREFGMRYEYRPHLSLVYAHIHDRPDVAERVGGVGHQWRRGGLAEAAQDVAQQADDAAVKC